MIRAALDTAATVALWACIAILALPDLQARAIEYAAGLLA